MSRSKLPKCDGCGENHGLFDPSCFKYVEKPVLDTGEIISGIMLLKPEKYKGFVFMFTDGKFGQEGEDGLCPVQYTFTTLDNSAHISDEEMKGEEFSTLLGDIFVHMVNYILEHPKNKKELKSLKADHHSKSDTQINIRKEYL